MIVRKMTASFGVLQNRTLELSPGLNIIEAPNEYGKTTWCAFLRAMLYGIDTAQRGRAGKKPDKVLYAPWNGAPMAGTMELSFGGKDITLSRSTRAANAPMRAFSAVYTRSSQPAPGLTGENAGETLTGASLPVFERTAFIGPAGLGVQQGAELERKITSLVTAGEEGGSFSEASARLRALQRKCRYRNSGRLPELEAEMASLREKLAAMDETADELTRAEEAAENAHLHAANARKSLAGAQEKRREEKKSRLEACRAEREKAENEAAQRESTAAAAEATLRAGVFCGAEPDETAAERARADERRAKRAESAANAPKPGLWIWILLLLAAGGFAAAGFVRREFWLGTLLTLLALAVLGIVSVFRSRERANARRVLGEILAQYDVEIPEDIPERFAAYAAEWEETEALILAAEEERERARSLGREELRLHEELTELLGGDAALPQMSESEKKEQLLREEIARLRGRLDTLGDPLVLKSRLCELEEEHGRVETELEALTIALDELALADEEMQSEFSPALAKSAAAALSRLTGGAYTELTLDRELNALVRCAGEPVLHESAFLSRGTADQLYLALRLALCDMLLGGEDPCPIVLDDALINFDDVRMGYALDYLAELAQHRQILLFSCHSREKRYMQTKNED